MKPVDTEKSCLRAELKTLRSNVPEALRLQNNLTIQQRFLSLPELEKAKTVFCFVSHGTEVHTHDIINQLLEQKKQLAIPKITDSKSMQAIAFHDWAELEKGELGILSPRSSEAVMASFDIVITPGLGFSENGNRLGFGRGYYDKWFNTHEAGLKIALAYDIQLIKHIPVNEFDVNVDMIITEKRVIRLSGAD